MSRRIIYRIQDDAGNRFTEPEWQEIERLQHWYNSEFSWSTGRLAIKRFVVFPNSEVFQDTPAHIREVIAQRFAEFRSQGLTEPQIITRLEQERLILVKWGGYYDNCLASGFTRIADNEWNAYLVCDFLLKASTLSPRTRFSLHDEGRFVKTGSVDFRNGTVELRRRSEADEADIAGLCAARQVFAIVDPAKYNRHPTFRNMIPEFNKLKTNEKKKLISNWNWLGYESSFGADGDDRSGFDLNSKVRSFLLRD